MEGRRIPRAGVVFLVLLMAFVFAIVAPSYAATYNNGCTACHSSAGQWDVAPVDRGAVCQKCHTPGLLGSHPKHNPGSNCGAICHPSWGASLQYATPAWRGAQGSFASSSSVNLPATTLHVIHSNPRWMSTLSTTDSKCASCHSVAACSACHEDAPEPFHGTHASIAETAWTGVVGSGVIGEDQTVETAVTSTLQCASSSCHSIAGNQARAPQLREDNGVGVTKNPVANWSIRYGSNYTAGRILWSNKSASTATLAFTGQQVDIVSDKDPYRGIFAVSVDGGPETLVDGYSSTTSFQQILYRSPLLSPGAHTITVRVTGTKNASARAAYVFLDAFRFYDTMPEFASPACISCHAATCSGTGGGFTHEASATAGTYRGFTCQQCHTMRLKDEHLRSSSKTAGSSCGACHTVYADYGYDDYDMTCGSTGDAGRPGCHQAAQAPHLATDTSHTVAPGPAVDDCIVCHSDDLGVIHDDSNATRPQHASLSGAGSNGEAYATNCLTCHGTTSVSTITSCVSASCHQASGIVSMATHPAPDHDANPALGEATRTAGKACVTCHAINGATGKIDAVGEHGKSTARTSGNAAIGCGSCHGAPYFPTDWLGANNTCVSCHPSDASKAGAPHEAADYAAKHNFSADSGNSLSCGSGAGVFCHNTNAADAIHDASNPGTGDCESCHTPAIRQTGVPTVRACSTCHVASHDLNKHVVSGSAQCVTCHDSTDVRDLHADCATCHANPSFPGLTGGVVSADCVNCHKAGSVGNKAYSPVDPSHATGNEATHTATPFTSAYQGAGGDGTVPAEGKQCSTCHTATLKVAHATVSVSGGSVSCDECHLNTTLNAAGVVAGNWSAKKCTDCHDTGASSTHDAYGSTHVVVAGTCAGTGASCHDYTDLAKLHDKNQSGGAPTRQSCSNNDAGDPTGCHNVKDSRPVRWTSNAASCGQGTSGCHTEKTPANHGKKHGMVPASSAYTDGAGEGVAAGCLSAGAGCHDSLGSGNTSTDIAAYHQTTDCATSTCHTSVDKPAHHQPFVCGDCHDGGYAGAVDTTALADATPGGHYGTALHTATGGLGSVTTGGSASEPCSTCHDLSLAAAHTGVSTPTKGAKVTCSECHGYNVNVISQVKVSNWTANSCSDCHTAGVIAGSIQHASNVAVVVTATGSAGCSSSGRNCHNSSDLHVLHRNEAAGCDLSGCHDATNKNKRPTAKSCGSTGACHTAGYNTNTTFPTHTPSEEASHAPTNTSQELATWSVASQSVACGACHLVSSADGGLRGEHVKSTSAMTVAPGNVCQNCHGSAASDTAIATGWAANRNSTNACLQCHTAGNGMPIHADQNSAAHSDVASAGCGNTGGGCHPTADLAQVGTPSTTANIHSTCLRCHDHTGSATVPAPGGSNMTWNPALDTCGQGRECHNIGTQYPTSGDPVHRNGLADAANGDDVTHHTGVAGNKTNYPESGTGVYSDNQACTVCHTNTLKAGHATVSTNGGSVTCTECHNGSGAITAATASGQIKSSWSTDKCTDCHTSASTHTTFKGGAGYSANHVATMNASCSGSGTGCHGTRPDTVTAVAPAGELTQLHTTPGCSGTGGTSGTSCHALNKPMSTIGKSCGSGSNCHSGYTTTAGHAGTITGTDATHTVTAASMDAITDATYTNGVQCKNCHSSNMRSAHTTVTVTMESGASWAAGAAPFCTNCHNTTAPVNAASAIKTTAWNKTCDACHVTAGPGKHARYTAANHTATTSGCSLATGCHGFTGSQSIDIRALHDRPGIGCAATGTDSKGWAGGCHSLDKSMVGTTMTCGDTGACHNAHTPTNHIPNHDISTIIPNANLISAAPYSYHGVSYTAGNSWGCGGCHFMDLIKEHGSAASGGAGRTLDDGPTIGAGCGVCHTNQGGTVGSPTSRSAIVNAITAGVPTTGDMRCTTCHNGLATGTTKPHMGTATTTASKQKTTGNPLAEFTDDGYKAGGHNIGGTAFAKTNPDNNGATAGGAVAWSYAPGVSTPFVGTNPRTGATWTRTDQLLCSDCHRFSASATNGPQGAAAVYEAWAGGTTYTTNKNWFNGAAPYVLNGTTGTYGMCSGCHGELSGTVHGQGNHNLACISCHTRIPHQSSRPRLLAYQGDTAPYNSISGLTGVKSTATPGSSSNCVGGGCGKHTATAPYW